MRILAMGASASRRFADRGWAAAGLARLCGAILFSLLVLSAAPATAQGLNQPKSAGAERAMRFELTGNGGNCIGCEWIAAVGRITPETPALFRREIVDAYPGLAVMFESDGGDMTAALELGRLIRARGMSTSVGDRGCLGACAFAFLGGEDRFPLSPAGGAAGSPAGVGFHLETAGASAAPLIVGYLLEMGASAELFVRAARTPVSQPFFPNSLELTTLKVDTPRGLGPFALEPYRGGLVLFAREQSTRELYQPRQVTLFCRRSDGAAHFLLTSSGDWVAELPAQILSTDLITTIGGLRGRTVGVEFELPQSAVSESGSNGDKLFDLALSRADFERLFEHDGVFINLGVPRVAGEHGARFDVDDALRQAISILLKNCI